MYAPAPSLARVLIAVGAGFAVAFHVGKVPAALPGIVDAFGLGLVQAAFIVSAFSVLAALSGLFVGRFASRVGNLRAALAGLATCALGSLLGSLASGYGVLLAGRLLEGFGFILAVVALPPLVTSRASAAGRPLALGLWGTFMPGGMSIMLLASPALLGLGGWRGLWQVSALALVVAALVLWLAFRDDPPLRSTPGRGEPALAVLRRGPLLLAACFCAYSAQFIAVTSFLPTLLTDTYDVSVARAARTGAGVVAANVIGNIAAGWLMQRGVAPRALLVGGALAMGVATFCFFSETLPLEARIAAAFAFASIGGLLPGALFASTPVFAASTAQIAILSGLLLQGSGIGQVAGPALLAQTVEGLGGWGYAPLFTVTAAVLGALAAWCLPRVSSPPR